jgi:hypothetical protein
VKTITKKAADVKVGDFIVVTGWPSSLYSLAVCVSLIDELPSKELSGPLQSRRFWGGYEKADLWVIEVPGNEDMRVAELEVKP